MPNQDTEKQAAGDFLRHKHKFSSHAQAVKVNLLQDLLLMASDANGIRKQNAEISKLCQNYFGLTEDFTFLSAFKNIFTNFR